MVILYRDDQDRIIDLDLSQQLRRIEVVDCNENKYTGFIDSHKNGWSDVDARFMGGNLLLGPGPGVLDYEVLEDGNIVVKTKIYFSNESEVHQFYIMQTYDSIDANGHLGDLLDTEINKVPYGLDFNVNNLENRCISSDFNFDCYNVSIVIDDNIC